MYHSICPPPRPPAGDGVLLPRILAHERRSVRDLCTVLEVCGLPECACPPWKLVCVQTLGDPPRWHILRDDLCGRITAEVHIPVAVTISDSRGCTYSGTSMIRIETTLPSSFSQPTVLIVPCVHLTGCGCCSESSCFHASLSVTLDVYRLKLEPCCIPPQAPSCPQLPLYPPPIHPRCM